MLEDIKNVSENNEIIDNFNLNLEGFDGPIDLLLELAKKQKVDLSNINVLELANQYILYINKYKSLHLEIAADYLVMAAWLTFLKSKLLLPKTDEKEDHTPEDLEAALKYQLQRLSAIQDTSHKLYSIPLINRDVFYRGFSNEIKVKYNITYSSTLYDLLKSYSQIIIQKEDHQLSIEASELITVEQSILRLKGMFGSITEWTNFMNIIPKLTKNIVLNKSSISSNFVSSLELAKNGFIDVKQEESFGNIFIKVKNNG